MALDPVVNFFQSEIATLPVSDAGVTIVVSSGDGAKLPNPAVDGAFNLTIYKDGDPFASPEIVRVTARSTDTLTVTRAQEGSIATTKTAGSTWKVVMFPTAKTIQDIDSLKVNKAGDTMTGTLVVPTVTATNLGGTLSTASQPNVTSVGTLSSATITGDLTVDTSTLKVDSANNRVGIGTASPVSTLHVRESAVSLRIDDTQAYNFGASGPVLQFTGLDSSSGLTLFGSIIGTPQNGNPDRGYLNIATRVDGVNTQTLQIGTGLSADVIVNTGNLGVGVTPTSRNNTRLQIVDGIGFPATQVASSDPNTLDDYEEGTFDFAIAFGGSSTGVTYTNRQGKYIKIGNQVFVIGRIDLSSKGAEVGSATITGLPFSNGSSTSNQASISIGFTSGISFADYFTGYLFNSTTVIELLETTNAGILSAITNAEFTDTASIVISMTYLVS
jgi:hypothetical protein